MNQLSQKANAPMILYLYISGHQAHLTWNSCQYKSVKIVYLLRSWIWLLIWGKGSGVCMFPWPMVYCTHMQTSSPKSLYSSIHNLRLLSVPSFLSLVDTWSLFLANAGEIWQQLFFGTCIWVHFFYQQNNVYTTHFPWSGSSVKQI